MQRKIYQDLLQWKNRNGASALLIKGARRVGKSYIAEEFGKNEYKSCLKIDFNDISDDTLNLIVSNLFDRDRLFSYLQLTFGITLYERNSLIIFDEVQLCPKVRASIKYLVADHRYDYIETGSLLSIKKNTQDIVIPSEEEPIMLYPMDFEEYLWACGQDKLMDYIKLCFNEKKPLEPTLHRKVMTFFKEYMVVGGMPQAVAKFIETRDFNLVYNEQMIILSLYRADIEKHTGNMMLKVENIFDTVPSQLSKHEKKFRLAEIDENARMRDYIDPFTWLEDAMFVNTCYNSTEPNVGLKLNEDRMTLKCYMGDTGLLFALAFDDIILKNEVYKKIIIGKLEINEGMFTENIVAQMLKASGHNLYFFSNSSRENKDDRMKIDFLIAKSKITGRHNISPIEVKSNTRYTLTSLEKFRRKYDNYMAQPYVIHPSEFREDDGIIFLPLYMVSLL